MTHQEKIRNLYIEIKDLSDQRKALGAEIRVLKHRVNSLIIDGVDPADDGQLELPSRPRVD